MNYKILPIFLAFLCMGFGDAVNSFVGVAKGYFQLSTFESSLIPMAGFIMFGLLSVPMGVFQDRKGRKKTLMIGLCVILLSMLTVMLLGLSQYTVFLLSILLLGAGATILQVAGNPIMRDVSDEGAYASNLSLGQFVKAIGSFTAPVVFYIADRLGYTQEQSWSVLFPIFAAAVIVSIISIASLKITEKASDHQAASVGSCLGLLKHPFVLMMVLCIFLYVGAEVCLASGMPVYFSEQFGVSEGQAAQYVIYFFVTVMIGRLLGAILLRRVASRTFLVLTCWLAVAGFALLAAGSNVLAGALPATAREIITTIALIVLALGYANIFPLVFSIAIDRMPDKSNELSGLMVSAICGGAFLFPLMGGIGDLTGNLFYGFVIPLAAIGYILAVAVKLNRQHKGREGADVVR